MTTHELIPDMNDSGWRLTGWHILGAMVAFFSIIIAVNVVFLYFAVTTFSGIETEDAYRKGISYNERLAEARQLEKLGWQGKLAATADRKIELTLLSEGGTPIRGIEIEARVGRPSTDKFDADLKFVAQGEGRYVADAASLAAGNWIVTLQASDSVNSADAPKYRLKERLWLSQ